MDRLTYQGQCFARIAASPGYYIDRATIKRKVSAKSGLDTTYSPETVATSVPCRIKPSSAEERQIAGATQGSTAYTVRMPYWHNDVPIALDSKCFLEIAARAGGVEAQTLHVVAPLPGSGTMIDAVAIRQS